MMFGFLLILIVLAIFYFRGYNHEYAPGFKRDNDPLQLLRERYARGEISSVEFSERKKILEQQ